MKNFVLAIFVMCVLPIALSSCSDDEKSLEPLTANSIKGEYVGALTINGDTVSEVEVSVDEKITVADFPIDSILEIVVPEEYLDDALSMVSAVDYEFDYTTSIFGLNLFVDFTFVPVEIVTEYGGSSHAIEAVFYAEDSGNYNGSDYSFTFELLLKSVTLDGVNVPIANSQLYLFDLNKIVSQSK